MGSNGCFHALSGLSLNDQTKVSQFGRGDAVTVPHSLIHEAFERVVDNHPSAIAAKFGGKAITYQQLDIAGNRLANHLIDSGLKPRQRVCLVVQRSFEMLIGILAILKSGSQYVPIDGGVTSEQALMHIVADIDARFILCMPKFWDKTRRFARRDAIIFTLDEDVAAFYPSSRPQIQLSSNDGAYVIYTSGMFTI
jgi:non-ribosomal peptide synthetase component F